MATSSKKRKVTEEMRVFQENCALKYLFVSKEAVAMINGYNLKRHCETERASKYHDLEGHFQSVII
jgi:hypothetical protein